MVSCILSSNSVTRVFVPGSLPSQSATKHQGQFRQENAPGRSNHQPCCQGSMLVRGCEERVRNNRHRDEISNLGVCYVEDSKTQRNFGPASMFPLEEICRLFHQFQQFNRASNHCIDDFFQVVFDLESLEEKFYITSFRVGCQLILFSSQM